MKRLILTGEAARKAACREILAAPEGWTVKLEEPKRNLAQNAALWAALTDVANQVLWPVDGALVNLTAEDWKAILTAGLKRHQRMAKGIDGGLVVLGSSTSRMSKREMGELLELIQAFGAQHGVKFSARDEQ